MSSRNALPNTGNDSTALRECVGWWGGGGGRQGERGTRKGGRERRGGGGGLVSQPVRLWPPPWTVDYLLLTVSVLMPW